MPRGVGKWSLMGDSHCSIFSTDFDLFLRARSETGAWDMDMVIVMSSPSSSIMGLRVLPCRRPWGEGGRYVVAGKRIKSAITIDSSNPESCSVALGSVEIDQICIYR